MASFVAAMSAPDTKKAGVKGSDVYTEEGVGDRRVALFQQLVRDCKPAYITEQVSKAFAECADKPDVLRDYAVMAFQTRDIRGGKGERDIFYSFLIALFHEQPAAIKPLINLIPEYGCWLDCWKLWELVDVTKHEEQIKGAIKELVKFRFFEDLACLETPGKGKVSLLGKWMPRETSKYAEIAREFAELFYPEIEDMEDKFRAYRKACSKLNAHLNTTEIHMCNGEPSWAKIVPGSVPGRLLSKARKAFLNEIVERSGKSVHSGRDGLRYPDSEDRMKCRQNFLDHTAKALKGEVKMKGADVVYPHELVAKHFSQSGYITDVSKDESDMIEAQWRAIRDAAAAQGGLGRAVAMSDFSGSMRGTPMEVSMALGILISELTHPAFRGYFLGFDSNPSWINVSDKPTLREKIIHVRNFAQGLSTDFQKAADLILRRLVEHKVPAEEAPTDLIVLTDMGFDAARGNDHGYSYNKKTAGTWQTHIDMIRANFAAHGYTAPRIVLWNLRAEYKDFHAKSDDDGVVVLSGWSPAVLKAITAGNITIRTPFQGMKELLDAPRYDAVRAAWDLAVALRSKE